MTVAEETRQALAKCAAAGFKVGVMAMPSTTAKPRPPKLATRLKRPAPPKFDGTPKERAFKAVEYAKAGFTLVGACAACGYPTCYSGGLKELVYGPGVISKAAWTAAETGVLDFNGNRAALRIVRDYYDIPNIKGADDEDNELLRAALQGKNYKKIAHNAGLHPTSVSKFATRSPSHKRLSRLVRANVWAALKQFNTA